MPTATTQTKPISGETTKESEKVGSNSTNLNDLTFVHLKNKALIERIPLILIENVKGRTFTPEQFYRYQISQIGNPCNYLYALIDKGAKMHGYLWVETNLLDDSMFVNTFSIDKEYWGKGEAISKVIAFLDELKKKTKSPRVFWVTTNEKFFIKQGFKRSKNVLMEYNTDQQ